jgi:hypothetical protein
MIHGARALALCMLALASAGLAQAATITIQVMDSAGEGFNDAAPFTPIGGNPATTLGQARLNVFNQAAQLWGALISSPATIVVQAKFDPQTCTASSGTLGSAGPSSFWANFPGAVLPNVFYPTALASAQHGSAIDAAHPGDISATFNSAIGGDPNCLASEYFYLGYDHQLFGHNDGKAYAADLLGVVLHELGHGLGFLTLVNQSGQGLAFSGGSTRFLGAYDQFIYDEGTGMFWKDMTPAQRATSANGGGSGNTLLAWNSTRVNAQASREVRGLTPLGHVRLSAPASFDASSSVSHWDIIDSPDLLMEPQYSRTTGSHTDLTSCVLYDLGWQGSRCPDDLLAVAQSVSVSADVARAITLAAANANGATLDYSITIQPIRGTLGAIVGNSVSYTPAAGYTGSDQFSFAVDDGVSISRPAVVSIDVQIPTIIATPQTVTATAGTALALTLSSTGGGADTLSYAITMQPAHGTLGALAGAQLTYTPEASYTGADSFSFQASTALATSIPAAVSITVQAAPSGGSTGGATGGGGGGGALEAYGLCALALGLLLRLAAAGGLRPWQRLLRLRAAARAPRAR